jgi:hypothetical protein
MAKGTGFGQAHLIIMVRVEKPYDIGLIGVSGLEQVGETDAATTFQWSLKGRPGDDETISYEWLEVASVYGIPHRAWQILWNESDWLTTR